MPTNCGTFGKMKRDQGMLNKHRQSRRSASPLATEQAHVGILAEALLELRELAVSGSEEMGVIDEALGKVGISPWKARHPECKGRGTVHTIDEECDHCRQCGGWETDPDGLCEICLKCSLCCEDETFSL
jgi:hypothetical protein